jgi:hypothetical protein
MSSQNFHKVQFLHYRKFFVSTIDYNRPVLSKYYPDKAINKKQISNLFRKNADNCNNIARDTYNVFQRVTAK